MNSSKIEALKQALEAATAAYEAEKTRLTDAGIKSQDRYEVLKPLKAAQDAAHAELVKNWRPLSKKELAKMEREYNAAFHELRISQETEKAVAVAVEVEYCDLERDANDVVWLPKSALVGGRAPGWLLNRKLDEVHADHSSRKLGSVLVKFA